MATVFWTQSPTNIATQIATRKVKVARGVVVLGQTHAKRAEGQMKARAPWNDRTGNARAGLFGQVEAGGTTVTVILGGTVDYQPYLELGTSRMAPRPIIVPVANETAAALAKDAGELVRRLFG
jgi:HK97 gp10 family phage protein